ncbi:MAG: hypothetical protein QOF59_49 [Actinomycetota bacterium]|nr:hypothetical protein [Actinomycetota bacterium]MDQ1461129.1 hypothetical protein [Actinomycetota bacterium]
MRPPGRVVRSGFWNQTEASGLIVGVKSEASPPLRREGVGSSDRDFGARFDECYRANALWAARLSFLLTADAGSAEDITQEAFLGLHQHFDAVDNPHAYLRVTLVRLASRRRRREARRHSAHALVANPAAVSDSTSELFDVVARLPARQRAVIVLRYFEDLSEAEISATLACPPGTVKSLSSRALRRLKTEIDP